MNVSKLKRDGKSVGDLRKIGISPAEIRAAGYTLEEMNVYLGIDRLCEAGFTLEDFCVANFDLGELKRKFNLTQILQSSRGRTYTLPQLLQHFPAIELKTIGGFTSTDFHALGNISAAQLRQLGFSEEEITACGVNETRSHVNPGPWQPPHAATMTVGESWNAHRTGAASTFLEVFYQRIPESEARDLLSSPYGDQLRTSSYSYDGSGKNCPRCGRLFVLLEKVMSSDGMCGVERGTWLCDDPQCGMRKKERYEGYGTIF